MEPLEIFERIPPDLAILAVTGIVGLGIGMLKNHINVITYIIGLFTIFVLMSHFKELYEAIDLTGSTQTLAFVIGYVIGIIIAHIEENYSHST